jgi:mannitol-1-/sugar-/sorbitol-6-phosphatase
MLSANSTSSAWTGPLTARGLLFDLDGTIIDSSLIFDAAWTQWAHDNGIAPEAILSIHHGRRIPDTIAAVTPPGFDLVRGEAEVLALASSKLDGLRLLPGIDTLLHALPPARWGIVTSSYRDLVERWFTHFGLPQPAVLVTSQDVARGKPDPEGFRRAAAALGCAPQECIIFEDAPAGIDAAEAAGGQLIVVASMLTGDALTGRNWIADYRGIRITQEAATGAMTLQVDQA